MGGVGGRSHGEDVAVEMEEVVTMVAKVTVQAMVSRGSQVGLGVVSSSLC